MANVHVAGLLVYLMCLESAMALAALSAKIKGLAKYGVVQGDYGESNGTTHCVV